MKGAPSQQGGGSGGFGGGGFPQWLGMASQYFPQYFGGWGGGQTPQTGYMPPGQTGQMGQPGQVPQNPQQPGHATPYGWDPFTAAPPATPPTPPQTPPQPPPVPGTTPTMGLLGGSNTSAGQFGGGGLLNPQTGWMPGYGGTRFGSGTQPGAETQPGGIVPGGYAPQKGYGLFGQFGQY